MTQPPDERAADLVQAGAVRAALFLPQYIDDPASGTLRGRGTGLMTIAITRVLASHLGIAVQTLGYPTPAAAAESLAAGGADLAFMGIEPSRMAILDFSPAMFEFDYTYLVPAGSSLHTAAEVDRPGHRIAVVHNHASTLALARAVKHAELIRSELPETAFDAFCAGRVDALAFPRDVLIDYAARHPVSRVLADAYGINRVGIAIGQGQPRRLAYLRDFVEEAKRSGLIRTAIDRAGLRGFRVAPMGI